VAAMFNRCGLKLSSERPFREVVGDLVCEGLQSLNKYNQIHKNQLVSFMNWCEVSDNLDLCSNLSEDQLKLVGFLAIDA